MTANLLIGMDLNFRYFSECVLIDHATRSDLQSAPFATRDTPPERGFVSHRSKLGNSDVIGSPRHSERRSAPHSERLFPQRSPPRSYGHPTKTAAQELIHGRQEFVGRSINSNSESFQRLQARDAGGVVEIEASETCEPAQRLQTRDARGVVEVEPAEVCQPLQRLQARNSDSSASEAAGGIVVCRIGAATSARPLAPLG